MINQVYVDKLVAALKQTAVDAIYIAPSQVMDFLIGMKPIFCERFQGLFVTAEGVMFYICPLLTEEEAGKAIGHTAKIYTWSDTTGPLDTIREALKENGLISARIAVDGAARICDFVEILNRFHVSLVNGKEILEEIRIIKTRQEREGLVIASRLTDQCFLKVLEFIKPSIRECDIRDKMLEIFQDLGGEGPYGAFVASGPGSSMPHYETSNRIIEEEDIILFDMGCLYHGMHADLSRTVFVGAVSDEQKKVYEIVREANEAGEAFAKAGVLASEVDKVTRDVIEKAGYGDTFVYRTGHGVGYEIHEAPDIKGSNPRMLEEGMAFTIEPGIYLKGRFGIRIEDVVLLDQSRTRVLNEAPKDIIVI